MSLPEKNGSNQPADVPWRKARFWDGIGLVLTMGWFIFFAIVAGGDKNHPLADLVFMVPIGIWSVVILAKRLLCPPPRKPPVQ